MIKKSISANSLVSMVNTIDTPPSNFNSKRMVKTKSYDNIHDALLNDEKITNTNWNNVEHIATMLSYTPINSVLACVPERSFPISLVSKTDNTSVELGICLSNPENFIKEESANEELFYDIKRQMNRRIKKHKRLCYG